MTVTVLGIRHHGPGSARSVERALRELGPDAVLVEGPPEAEPVLPLAAHAGMRPPVALLAYAPEDPGRAVFYPFARFSPEWGAIRHALATDATLRMIDLPAGHVLSEQENEDEGAGSDDGPPPDPRIQRDPIGWLADAVGHADPERLWEDLVEHRADERSFEAVTEAMAALREAAEADGVASASEHEARREARMRQAIRTAVKEGHQRVAVVCGAWHAPALVELGPASADAALLKGLRRRKVAVTWVPWTYDRLAYRSGYGAGVTAPGWYDHLYRHGAGAQVLVRWLTRTARLLRREDVGVSAAHVIEAVRLAEALAALRERPLAGLPELTEATRAVLGEGADAALALIRERLVVGQVLGRVPPEAPTVPLKADLEREQRRLRLRPGAGVRRLDLDLRRDLDRDRSLLLHRLVLLGVAWGEQGAVRGAKGTFHELWELEWQPEYDVALVEASRLGSTVREAATAVVIERARPETELGALTRLVHDALLADLPDGLAAAMAAFRERAAVAADAAQLMAALPPLAALLRYGSVRKTATAQVEDVVEGLVPRVVAGLPLAVSALDDDAAAVLAGQIAAADAALGLLERADLLDPWRGALARVGERTDVHGRVTGRATRLLHDAGALAAGVIERRMGLMLSVGADPAAAAAWVEGMLAGGGLLLIHDEALLRLLDRWLAGVRAEAFTELLPLLRRTFATFPAGERRQIGERVRRIDGPGARLAVEGDERFDHARAERVMPVLALILGVGEEAG